MAYYIQEDCNGLMNAISLSEGLGRVMLLSNDSGRRGYSIASIISWYATPIGLEQCLIYSEEGRVSGIAIWAFVSPRSFKKLACGEQKLLLPEEWNDGVIPWIVDVMSPYAHPGPLIKSLRNRLGRYHNRAFYWRHNGLRTLRLSTAGNG